VEPILRIRDVEACYGRIQVLWGVSLDVYEGQIVTIVGPNGAGKTTLMRVISRVHKNTGGTLSFGGRSIDRQSSAWVYRSGLVQVPEQRGIFGALTVLENLKIGADWRTDRRDIEKDFEYCYALFPRLLERRYQPARTLSGGEQQMLAIGRGLMSRPKLLILDEPSVGLAPLLVAEIFQVVQKLKRLGITVLLVEQNAKQALLIADYGVVIESGKIVLSGTAAELMSDEAITAAYLGRRRDIAAGLL